MVTDTLKSRFGKFAAAVVLAGALGVAALPATALAAEGQAVDNGVSPRWTETVAGGAAWDHGSIPWIHGWSNVASTYYWHSSTVSANGQQAMSGRTQPGISSHADLWWAFQTYHAYWNVEV